MTNEEGTLQIVFNGEIYNFQDVRSELESRGYRFRTKSDTEALIHAYAEWGTGMLSKINGMFAIAIYDIPNRKLFIAPDRLGVKPFYYYLGPHAFVFASEMSGMVASEIIPTETDLEALDLYLHSPPAPRAAAEGAYYLPLGAFPTAEQAEVLRARLSAEGVPSNLETRVLVGPFADRRDALAAQARLREKGFTPGELLPFRR